jgi:hypothetical protein
MVLLLLSEEEVSAEFAAPRELVVVRLPVESERQEKAAKADEPWKLQHCEREIQSDTKVSWERFFILDDVAMVVTPSCFLGSDAAVDERRSSPTSLRVAS